MIEAIPQTRSAQWPALLIAGGLALFLLYLIGLDQGWLFSLAQGDLAFNQNLVHEFFHDVRHSAGFPCH